MSSTEAINKDKEWYELLSDDVILHILSYVNADTLYNISRLDNRLNILVSTKRLWRYIDGRSRTPPNRSRKLASFTLQHTHKQTKTLLLAGRSRFKRLFRSIEWVFSEPNYSTLTILALENQHLPTFATLKMFPASLLELSLRNSYNDNYSAFFKLSHVVMANLRVLILDGCRWVRSCMLVSVCKYPKLQVLSMVRCTKLQDSEVYVSLAANYGFASLRVLDVRHTRFGDSMVSAMVLHKRQLRCLYFASYSAVFYPDIMKQMQLLQEHRLECVGAQLDFDERKNSERLKMRIGTSVEHTCYGQLYQDITDQVGIYFARLRHDGADENSHDATTEYHSLLYKNPYSRIDCPCLNLAHNPHTNEEFPDTPICVVRDDSVSHAQSSSTFISNCSTNKVETGDKISVGTANDRRQRLYEITVPTPNDWHRYSSHFSIHGEGRVNMPFNELPGDEYESCCLAYNTAMQQHFNVPSSSTNFSSHTSTINNTYTTNKSIKQQPRKRKISHDSSDSTSSDSYTSSDDYDGPYRTIPPRPKAKKRLKRTIQQQQQQNGSIGRLPTADDCDNNDQARVIEVHLIEYNEAEHRDPMQMVDDGNAIQIIPVVQFNGTISSKLKQLSLRGFKKITDRTLESLEHLTDLRVLDVTGTLVTREGILRFLSANPRCRVVHQSFCRCLPLMHL